MPFPPNDDFIRAQRERQAMIASAYDTSRAMTYGRVAEVADQEMARRERFVNARPQSPPAAPRQEETGLTPAQMIERLRGQVGGQAGVSNEVLGELEGVLPLARAGLFNPDDVQRLALRSVNTALEDQRLGRRAEKDIQTIVSGFRNGRFNEQQFNQMVTDYEKTYGADGTRAPAYQQLKGMREQVLAGQEEKLNAFAAERGLDRRFVRWDERANGPTFNADEFTIEKIKADADAARRKPEQDYAIARFNALRPDKPRESDFKDSFGKIDRAGYERALQSYAEFIDKNLPSRLSDEQRADVNSRIAPSGPGQGGAAADLMAGLRPAAKPRRTLQNSTPMSEAAARATVAGDPSKAGIYRLSDGRFVEISP